MLDANSARILGTRKNRTARARRRRGAATTSTRSMHLRPRSSRNAHISWKRSVPGAPEVVGLDDDQGGPLEAAAGPLEDRHLEAVGVELEQVWRRQLAAGNLPVHGHHGYHQVVLTGGLRGCHAAEGVGRVEVHRPLPVARGGDFVFHRGWRAASSRRGGSCGFACASMSR